MSLGDSRDDRARELATYAALGPSKGDLIDRANRLLAEEATDAADRTRRFRRTRIARLESALDEACELVARYGSKTDASRLRAVLEESEE